MVSFAKPTCVTGVTFGAEWGTTMQAGSRAVFDVTGSRTDFLASRRERGIEIERIEVKLGLEAMRGERNFHQ